MVVDGLTDDTADRVFLALGAATRRDILARAIRQEQSVSALARHYEMSFAAVQKHVAVADKYYAFTREADGEQLFILMHSGDVEESITVELAGTTMADAKKLTPLFSGPSVQLQGT